MLASVHVDQSEKHSAAAEALSVSSGNQPPASADEPEVSTAAAVYAERVLTLYRQNVWIMAVNPLNTAIVAGVLWNAANRRLLAGWVAAMVAVTIARVIVRNRYLHRLPPVEATSLWARRFVAGATAAGMLWGLGGALFYDPQAPGPQLLIVFVIGGMVAGASGTMALHLPAFLGFAASAVLPLALRMLADGDRLHIAMGLLAIVYGIAMALVAANNHRAVTEAFRLRFENHDLLRRLSRAQISLADANRTLEQRVTERGMALERQTEALREAQRMESVGLLAGGMAHDFNNLLTAVLGNVELLLVDAAKFAQEDRIALEEIRRAANRGATLVSQLLTFSRRQVMEQRVLDLNAVVSEARGLLDRLIGEHVELEVTMHPGPLPVKGDPTQLQQVIINLATNARDAMPEGGKLTIQTELVDRPAPDASTPSSEYVVLSVRDTGVGMDAETKRMIFHPFFTTKEVGRGTGLGLATVYGIVEQSGGHVFVDSERGRGSCFRVFLPSVSAAQIESPAPAPPAVSQRAQGPATILLVEDEKSVRAVAARTLEGAGFTVIEAENGEQALELARHHRGSIDLVVSDVVMAKLGGPGLATRIAGDRPGIRILLVSGYSGKQMPSAGDAFLQKPFTPTDLLDKVSRLLTSQTTSGASTAVVSDSRQDSTRT